nr:putative ribonuclease H-like domain-containing protein [Tanacetum cinerariifolium]
MESQSETIQTVSALKLPMLKTGDYDLWSIKIEQYLTHTDYTLWEVIVNGDAPAAIASVSGGDEAVIPPKTTIEKIPRRNELKAKSTLLLAIPNEHLLKFHRIRDAKTLWEAIKTRFGGNKESKKIQKTILKQQYENFFASRSEGWDKTYNRFQKLISQLEIHDNTSSTNEAVNTTHSVFAASSQGQASTSTYADDVMFSFFANQSNSPQLDNNDLEQIDTDDLDSKDKTGLGYDSQLTEKDLSNKSNVFDSASDSSVNKSEDDNNQANDRVRWSIFKSAISENVTSVHETDTRKSMLYNEDKATGQREVRLVWNNAKRVNHQNFSNNLTHPHPRRNYVPTAVITNSGKVPVNATKQSFPRAATSTSTTRYVNTAANRPTVNGTKPSSNDFHNSHSPVRRTFNQRIALKNSDLKDTVKGNPQYTLKGQGIFNSGCSRHMMGNKFFLTDYQEIDGGFVAFGGSPKRDHLGKFKGKADEGFLVGYSINNDKDAGEVPDKEDDGVSKGSGIDDQEKTDSSTQDVGTVEPSINIASTNINTCSLNINTIGHNDPSMPSLEDTGIFDDVYDDRDVGAEADINNLELLTVVSHIPTTRVHKDYPKEHIIGDLNLATQTRRMLNFFEKNAMVSYINKQRRTNHKDYQNCLFTCFLSQQEPKKTLVDLPNGKRAIGSKWVFRNKKDERGIVIRNKERLVTQGYTQEESIDYNEVFAPVARIEAIMIFLAYASFMGFVVYQMDVKSAFLYGTIEDEVYVCQPPGFEDLHFPNKAYKVEKALYGLHQALRAWYETLSTYLLENRFRRGTIDKTLFIKKDKDDILLVQVYVDDIIFGSTKKSLCDEFEQIMHKRFQMSSMGKLTFFLRLQVKQKDDGIFISQDKYVADILKKFDFTTVKTASTPMDPNKTLIKDAEAEDVDVHLYRSMIGSLMYLTTSRPDIMFTVCAKVSSSVQKEYNDLMASNYVMRQSLETKFKLLQHDKSLEKTIETIEKEIRDIVKRFDAEKKVFENKISKLEKENNDLRTSYNVLKEKCETSCEKLKKENNDLKMHYKRLFDLIKQKNVASQVFTKSIPKVNVSDKIYTGKSSKQISKKTNEKSFKSPLIPRTLFQNEIPSFKSTWNSTSMHQIDATYIWFSKYDKPVSNVLNVGNKIHKAFPLPAIKFSLPEELPTASEDGSHCPKKRDATARKITLLSKTRRNCQSKKDGSYTKLVPHVFPLILAVTVNCNIVVLISLEDPDLSFQQVENSSNGSSGCNNIFNMSTMLCGSKYKTARELSAAILKTFGGNEATKKTKKNLLKQQYRNFRAEGSETLEQTFTRLQVIVAKHSRGNDEVNTASIYTASSNVPTASANVVTSQETACAYTASQSSGSLIKFEDINQIDEDDHALVADEEAPTEFALMANTSTEIKVSNNSLCSKDCKKNNDSLNSKITDLTDKLFDAKNMIYHYKLALVQVESRLVGYKEREVKYIEKIRTLEYYQESKKECIKTLKKELETLKREKEVVDGKLAGLLTASKDLDNLIESQRSDKSKEGLGYTAVPP